MGGGEADTHQHGSPPAMGIAALHPSYGTPLARKRDNQRLGWRSWPA